MDFQTIFNLAVGVGIPIMGWLLKSARDAKTDLQQAIDGAKNDLTAFRIHVAMNYVTHTDLSEIKQVLQRIEDKLDRKADK